jgi:hypothetical protein
MVSSIHTYIGSKFHIVHPIKSKQKGSTRRVDSINARFLIESKSANWERRKLEEEKEEEEEED